MLLRPALRWQRLPLTLERLPSSSHAWGDSYTEKPYDPPDWAVALLSQPVPPVAAAAGAAGAVDYAAWATAPQPTRHGPNFHGPVTLPVTWPDVVGGPGQGGRR